MVSTAGAVLFLHPVGLDRTIWAEVRSHDERALDFPGHGTEPPAESVSMAGLADHVLAQIEEPVTLVGLSLGGAVALQVAVRAPEKVASLVVACSTAVARPAVMAERAAAIRAGGMAGVLDSTLERWFTAEALATPGHAGVEYARARLLADDAETIAAYWAAMAEHDVASALQDIAMPTTIIAGARDAAGGPDAMRPLAEAVPGAAFEVIDGPHMLPLEAPGAFRAAVDRHLERATA
jgi:3-oxoadipate enol-lactonase